MSSGEPINLSSPSSASGKALARGRSSEPLQEDADVRSEKPQTNPKDRETDRKLPETDQTQGQDPKGVKGAFRRHPIAMIACFGLIVVGVIAGIAWYLHACHYESTDDAFIDGRPVLVSPQVTGSIISVNHR